MRQLLVLRPEPGATITASRAAERGLSAHCHALFRTEPVDWTMPAAPFDGLLLTSATAVRHAGPLPRLPVYAVGDATAEAARGAGARVASVGEGGVDALLANLPAGMRLLHLAGEERIAPAAPKQPIAVVPVYRTVPLADPGPELLNGKVLLVHSPAAGRRVAAMPCAPATIRIAAISEAAASACGARGWERIGSAERPTDEALLSLAASLCKD